MAEHLKPKDIARELGCSVRHAHDLMATMPQMDIGVGVNMIRRVSREDFEAWKDERKDAAQAKTASGSGAERGGRPSLAKGSRRAARIAKRLASRAPDSSENQPIRLTQPRSAPRPAT